LPRRQDLTNQLPANIHQLHQAVAVIVAGNRLMDPKICTTTYTGFAAA